MNQCEKRLTELEQEYKRNATTPGELKGEANEHLFEQMTDTLMHRGCLPWLHDFRPANPMENILGKTDFKLKAFSVDGNYLFWIRIQIKSSWDGARRFIESYSHPKKRVHVVVMNISMTTDKLQKILDSIYQLEKSKHPARVK